MGNLQKFGDVVSADDETAFNYYRLNSDQKKSVRWLVRNHLIKFCEYYEVVSDDFYSLCCLTRAGFNKTTQHILVTLVILKVHKDKLAMEVFENRLVVIGKKGGMRLVNPARRGTTPHGSAVLVAVPDTSVLGIRTFGQ